jgi:hypothetical protein
VIEVAEIQNRAVVECREETSFGTPACRDMSLGAEELNSLESSELAVAEKGQERELGGCEKKA